MEYCTVVKEREGGERLLCANGRDGQVEEKRSQVLKSLDEKNHVRDSK